MKYGHWHSDFTIEDCHIGFVYRIYNNQTKQYYIGIKQLKKKVTKPPLQGKKRKRITYKESDWKTYNSSGNLKYDIEQHPENYQFSILSLHKTISDLKIEETHQIIHHVKDPLCVNQMINIRLRIRK